MSDTITHRDCGCKLTIHETYMRYDPCKTHQLPAARPDVDRVQAALTREARRAEEHKRRKYA